MPERRSEQEALEFAEKALLSVKRPHAPERVRERVTSRIHAIEAETSWLWRLLSRPAYAFVAGVLLFVMLGASLWISPAGQVPPAVSIMVSPLSPVGVSVPCERFVPGNLKSAI
ncbi:MAG TPA: hypothetical protein VFI02_04735 [Armatimonadota bacterium]|nr:hypothetical protein [Armatimonadota bacterium]